MGTIVPVKFVQHTEVQMGGDHDSADVQRIPVSAKEDRKEILREQMTGEMEATPIREWLRESFNMYSVWARKTEERQMQ